MAAWIPRTGAGTILTGAVSTGFTPKVRNYNGFSYGRESLDCTNMTTVAGTVYTGIIPREYLPGDISTSVEITLDLIFGMEELENVPLDAAAEVWTWQFLPIGAETTGGTLVWSGFMLSWSLDVQYDNLIEGTATMQMVGEPNWTDGT
tara:strand:+ start:1215 stop:1658 length:444 start_codon:yes stop_codon:yes gene_type:complete